VNYNRQQKRAMAKQGLDQQRTPTRKTSPTAEKKKERTSPLAFFSEVRGELRKVDWPTKKEVANSSVIVLITVVIMTTLIFGFDWASLKLIDLIIR
jgi:preprotein translocase subunit SecE